MNSQTQEEQVIQMIATGHQATMFELLREVLSGQTRMSASSYMRLIKAINRG